MKKYKIEKKVFGAVDIQWLVSAFQFEDMPKLNEIATSNLLWNVKPSTCASQRGSRLAAYFVGKSFIADPQKI